MTSLINGEAESSRQTTSRITQTEPDLTVPINEAVQSEYIKLKNLDLIVGGALYAEPVSAVRYAIKWGRVVSKCNAGLPLNLIGALVHHAKAGDPTCYVVLQWLIARQSINGSDVQQANQTASIGGSTNDQV